MKGDVVVVDYGSGNIRSMVNALQRAVGDGERVVLSSSPDVIGGAERIVLPGVGAFAECRRKLESSGVVPALTAAVRRGTPFLGVCVGMQILADEGREFENTPGLGWIPGACRRLEFPAAPAAYEGPRKLPHIGWDRVEHRGSALFDGIDQDAHFYFVHSYVVDCAEPADVAATGSYGETFTAAVLRGNLFGCQFHPEKSDVPGLRLLHNFCRWKP